MFEFTKNYFKMKANRGDGSITIM